MLKILRDDISKNIDSGILTVIFLVNYRLGRYFFLRKGKIVILWVPYIFFLINYRFLCVIFGCSIPFSTRIGRSVVFKHGLYGVFISGMAEIGGHCTVFHHVTIGSNYGSKKKRGAPVIKNGVLIGAGAKIIGPLVVGNDAVIAAGCVVYNDVAPATLVKPPMAKNR